MSIATQILPELVSGRGTARRSRVVEGCGAVSAASRRPLRHWLRQCHLPETSSGRIVWALPLLLSACTYAPTVAPAAHPTIVSLNPCADAILAEVTAPGQLLAISHYSHDPRGSSMPLARARRFPATGGTVEEIAALAPDLVVGDSFTAPATRNALRRLGIRFAALPIAPTIAASEAQTRFLADLAQRREAGERLVKRIDDSLRAAAPPAGWIPRSAIVWQGGGLVAGDETLIAELMDRAGLRSTAATRGLGQGAILPLEAMLADPPRVILAAGNPRAEQDRLLRHPVLAGLTQTARARLDPGLFYCGGPSIPRALARLTAVRDALAKPLPFRGGVGGGVSPVTGRWSLPTDPTPTPLLKGRGLQ